MVQRNTGTQWIAEFFISSWVNIYFTLSDNSWNHLCIVYDGSNTFTAYVNGTNAGTGNVGAWPNSLLTQNTMCYTNDATWGPNVPAFSGRVTELRIYNSSLSSTQAANLFNWSPCATCGTQQSRCTNYSSLSVDGTSNKQNWARSCGTYQNSSCSVYSPTIWTGSSSNPLDYGGNLASYANDKNLYSFSTNNAAWETNVYYRFDFSQPRTVVSGSVWNRFGTCTSGLPYNGAYYTSSCLTACAGFKVYIGNDSSTPTTNQLCFTDSGNPASSLYSEAAHFKETFYCPQPIVGRYAYLYIAQGYFSVGEAEFYGPNCTGSYAPTTLAAAPVTTTAAPVTTTAAPVTTTPISCPVNQIPSNGQCVCAGGYYNASGTCTACVQGNYCPANSQSLTVCPAGSMSGAGASVCTPCANPCTNTSIALATCGLLSCPDATPVKLGNTSWYGLGRIEASTVGSLVVPASVWDVQGESALGLMLNATADRPTSLVQSAFTVISGHKYALRFKAVCTGLYCSAGLQATWVESATTLFSTTNVSQSWMDIATSYFTATSASMTLRFTAFMPNTTLSATVWIAHIYLADLGQWSYSPSISSLQLQSGLALPHRFSAAYVENYPRVVMSIASGAYIQHSATVFPVPQLYQLTVWVKGTLTAQFSLNGGSTWLSMASVPSIDVTSQPSWSQLVWTANSSLTNTTMLVRLTAGANTFISDPQLFINQTMANLPCVTCIPNYWCGAAVANLCPLNTLSPAGAASMGECYCRPGYYGTPFTSCAICPVNHYCTGGTDAVVCPNGTYSDAGSSACLPCPAGEYCALGHVGTCPAHSYSDVGASDVTQCACVAGYFGIAPNCAQCDVGYYCTGGATETACVVDATTPPGATNYLQCTCVSGFYGIHNDACTPCPVGSWCFTGLQNACPSNTYSSQYSFTITNCSCDLGYTGADGGPCSACLAGTYKDHIGTDACTQCPAGTISLSNGATSSSSCTGCGVGTYSGGSGSVTCQVCNSGSYAPTASQTACTPCAAGTWSSNSASICTTCAAGTWSAEGSSICTTCAAGSWAAESASVCTTCTPGTWAAEGASTCTSCTSGHYASSSGASECLACGSGSFSGDTAPNCTACTPGSWSLSAASSCTPCTPGLYAAGSSASTCLTCSAGSFSGQNAASVCTLCTPGSWSLSIASACIDCTPGYYANASASSTCLPCVAGSFAGENAASVCSICTPGSWSHDNSSTCTNCTSGYYASDFAASTCTTCAAGSFSGQDTASVCTLCTPGSWSLSTASVCTNCTSGYYASAFAASTCITCAAGSFSGQDTASVCTLCTPGSWSLSTASVCTDCTPGYHASGSAASTCDACTAGSFSGDTAAECTACSPGSWSHDIAASCTNCTPGLYASGSSASTCLDCASGSFTDHDTASVCTLCSPGSWSHTTASVCTSCDAGKYTNASGMADCLNCTAGSFAHSAASVCTACSPGSWSPRTAPDCTLCAAGTFSTAARATTIATCQQCAPGYYSVSAGLTVCQPCDPGSYSTTPALVSQSQCTICPIGGICAGGASLAYCVAGTVGYATGFSLQSQCSACTPGYYCPGGAVITTCPLGSYSLGTSVPSAALCPKCPTNYYCTNTTTEIQCPVNTNSQVGSSDLASCVCNPGYRCEMVQVVHAEITLPINASQFAELQAAYIAAVAAAAGVDPSQVIIVSITDAPTSGARRSLDGSTPDRAIEVHASIYNSMHTGSPHRALRTLDMQLEGMGLPVPLKAVRISLQREVVRATRADIGHPDISAGAKL